MLSEKGIPKDESVKRKKEKGKKIISGKPFNSSANERGDDDDSVGFSWKTQVAMTSV